MTKLDKIEHHRNKIRPSVKLSQPTIPRQIKYNDKINHRKRNNQLHEDHSYDQINKSKSK